MKKIILASSFLILLFTNCAWAEQRLIIDGVSIFLGHQASPTEFYTCSGTPFKIGANMKVVDTQERCDKDNDTFPDLTSRSSGMYFLGVFVGILIGMLLSVEWSAYQNQKAKGK